MAYRYLASMKAKPGRREEVVAILLQTATALREAGCERYLVSVANADDVTIWVSERWRSKEAHDASLQLPEAQAAIERVRPMLTGEFTGQELTLRGGLGAEP